MAYQKEFIQDTYFKVLNLLEKKPDITQRDIAKVLNVSLGKVNYSIKSLIEKGMI